MKNFHIFIGYDEREHEVFKVAEHTIKKHTKSINVVVHKLHHKELREQGLFTRRWMTQRNGQMVCLEDNKPFSTQFSHSRFLVPELWRRLKDTNKDDFVMFVDCDFVFKEDLGVLLHEIKSSNQNAPVYAVKHNYKPTSETKMDNVEQSQYNGKLWSAMVVYVSQSQRVPDTTSCELSDWSLSPHLWVVRFFRDGRGNRRKVAFCSESLRTTSEQTLCYPLY